MKFGKSNFAGAGRTDELRVSAPILRHFDNEAKPYALFPRLDRRSVPLAELCEPADSSVIRKGALDEERMLVELDNARRGGGVHDIERVTEIGSDKLVFGNAHLLTAKLRPYLGKTIANPDPDAIGTTEWVPIRCGLDLRPDFLLLLMQTEAFLELTSVFMAGKEHPRIRPDVLFRVEVPHCSVPEQDAICVELRPLREEISRLEAELERSKADVATEVLGSVFGFDYATFRNLRVCGLFRRELQRHALGRDARLDSKFLSPATEHVLKELGARGAQPIAKYLARPIVLGASISPKNYDEETDLLYASMATIKRWRFDEESANTVSAEYFRSKQSKLIAPNDILMARSGEAIGKVALIDHPVDAVFADFTMRITPARVRPQYMAYYLMSSYFQHLVHANKKGHANFNIFPGQISELPIVVPTTRVQERVLVQMDAALGAFDATAKELEGRRKTRDERLFALLSRPVGRARKAAGVASHS